MINNKIYTRIHIIIYLNSNKKRLNHNEEREIEIVLEYEFPTIKNLHSKICLREQEPVINVPLQLLPITKAQ